MQVRFKCPACGQSHVLDMPETTIHLTCSRAGKLLELSLGISGEPKVKVLGQGDRGQAGAKK